MRDVQDFIELFYPNYSTSPDIAYEMDLYMAENKEQSDNVTVLLASYSQEDLDNNQLKQDWMEARINILETAIQAYINQNK